MSCRSKSKKPVSKLILGSGSPRRRQLLAELGYSFEVHTADVEELHDASISLRELCEHNARLKAEEVAKRFPDDVVLGADTLVYLDEKPLGKPKSKAEALQTLLMLSGRTHCVCTGMCLVYRGESHMFSEVTEVLFKTLSEEVAQEYMAKVDVMDKAGSYGIQEHGEMIVESVEGDFSNVVGLPQALVKEKIDTAFEEMQ